MTYATPVSVMGTMLTSLVYRLMTFSIPCTLGFCVKSAYANTPCLHESLREFPWSRRERQSVESPPASAQAISSNVDWMAVLPDCVRDHISAFRRSSTAEDDVDLSVMR